MRAWVRWAAIPHRPPSLPQLTKEEMDQKSVLRSSWRKLLDKSIEVSGAIAGLQAGFKKRLLTDLKTFVAEVTCFRAEYLAKGPMVEGISPDDAMERLKRYEDEYELRQRKRELYNGGEDLFALPTTAFPDLDTTNKELQLLGKLYSLYQDGALRDATGCVEGAAATPAPLPCLPLRSHDQDGRVVDDPVERRRRQHRQDGDGDGGLLVALQEGACAWCLCC